MSKQNQLQDLNDAVSALDGSQARKWLLQLFDEETFVEIDRLAHDGDKPVEAVAGYGLVDGSPIYAFAQDREICSGAIGKLQAEKLCKIYALAAQNGAPVVGIFDSDGAKLGEGIDAMDAVAEILLASNNLSGVVPQIAVVAGACVGSSAVAASNADIVISVDGADYYLNPGDENSEAAIKVATVEEALAKVKELVVLLPANNLSIPLPYESEQSVPSSFETVSGAIDAVCDSGTAVRLYCGENETALARVGGVACGLVAMAENKLSCHSASLLARFVRFCDSFSLPIITFVDCAGFETLKGAAKLSHAYAEATTPKISVIVGKAYGSAYIAAAGKSAGADIVLAFPDAVVLPLAPETAIQIMWKDRLSGLDNPVEDRKKLAAEFAQTEGSAIKAAADGFVTDVITPAELKTKLISFMDMLSGKRVSRLPKKHSNIQL